MRRSDGHPGPVARTRRIALLLTVAGPSTVVLLTVALVTATVLPSAVAALPAVAAQADSPVSVAVDCEASEAVVTAPDDREYTVRVAVVEISPTGSATRSQAVGPLAGNSTVGFDGNGSVFAFALDPATGDVLARASAHCPPSALAADGNETAANATAANRTTTNATAANRTTTNATAAALPAITVDCNASEVRVVAPADLTYDLRVSTIRVTPTSTSTASVGSGPNQGNATLGFAGNGTVAAFALDPATGDVLAETVSDCLALEPAAATER